MAKNKLFEKIKKFICTKESKIFFWFDIAKEFHYLSIIIAQEDKKEIFDIWEIKNTYSWFDIIKNLFLLLEESSIAKNNIFIWLEVTGSYYFSLVEFIKGHEFDNIYIINGVKIKQFKNSLSQTNIKNDKSDSITIAEYIYTYKDFLENNDSNINWKVIPKTLFIETSNLKFLYRQYYDEKRSIVRLKSKIKDLTHRIMPELYEVFNKNKYSKMELFIKSNYTKEEITQMNAKDFYNQVMIGTNNREFWKKSYIEKLQKLQDIMKKSVWIQDKSGIFKWHMKILVEKYYSSLHVIEMLEELIENEIHMQNLFIPNIHGVWQILLGAFYSELWENLYRKDLKNIIGFIGWYPTENSSWWKILSKAKMQSKGNKILRYSIYLITLSLIRHHPEIKMLKTKIQTEKNITPMEAMIITWSYILRIIISLLKNKKDFSEQIFISNYLYGVKNSSIIWK